MEIVVNTNGLESKIKRKSDQLGPQLVKLLYDSARDVEKHVKHKAPRGKTGHLKDSINHKLGGTGAIVFANESIAPYVDYVIDGRGAFCAKNKQYLHFFYKGNEVFTKCVKASKPNPFFDKGYESSLMDVNRRSENFINWASNL
jgi:hypothetical protein